ncbi:hypothetical protein ACEPAG_264 [Sanghuangporus baumii]
MSTTKGDDIQRFLSVLLTQDPNKCYTQRQADLDVSKFRLYNVTRAGRSIHWFCDQRIKVKQIGHLEGRSCRLEEEMIKEMLQNVSPKRPIADCAFSQRDRFARADAPPFLHAMLQMAVCDRIKFSYVAFGSSIHRPPTLPISRPERMSSNVKCWLISGDEWQTTLSRLDEAFTRAASRPIVSNQTGQTALSSLAIVATDDACMRPSSPTGQSALATDVCSSDDYLFYAAVKHNFCLASLGLYALTLPQQMTKRGVPQSELVTMKAELLRKRPSEALHHLLSTLSEGDLLRAIYFAVAFSPFSLVCDKRVTNDSVARKTQLHEIAEALCYLSRSEDELRLQIEHALFRLIRKMAVQGSHIFDESIRAILAFDRSSATKSNSIRSKADEDEVESFRSINNYISGIVSNNYAFLRQVDGSVKPDDLRKDILFYILCTLKGKTASNSRSKRAHDEDRGEKGRLSKHRRSASSSSLEFRLQPLACRTPTKREHIRTVSEKWPIWPTTVSPFFYNSLKDAHIFQVRLTRRFKDLVSPMPKHELVSAPTCDTMEWKIMKREERITLLHDHQAAVGAWAMSDRSGPFHISLWDEEGVSELVKEADWVRVKGVNIAQLARITSQMHVDISLETEKQTYNAPLSTIFGSIGEGNICDRAFSCQSVSVNVNDQAIPRELWDLDDTRTIEPLTCSGQYDWKTSSPVGVSSRSVSVHIASRSYTSELQMTPSGLCTYIAPLIGSVRVYLPECIPSSKTDVELAWRDLDVQDIAKWKVCLASRKQEIFLKPGTPYFILHEEDCLAIKVNFYCSGLIGDTLHAIVREHYYGGTTTSLRDKDPIVLFKMFAMVVQALKSGKTGLPGE